MKLEKSADITQIIGTLAVVVTLIVLIIEVRGNTHAIRSQTAQGTFGLSAQTFYYPEGIVALDKLLYREEQLTEEERSYAYARLAAIFTTFDNHYYQFRQGNLDREIHDAYRARLETLIEHADVREFWGLTRSVMTQSFQDYVDEIIKVQQQ